MVGLGWVIVIVGLAALIVYAPLIVESLRDVWRWWR